MDNGHDNNVDAEVAVGGAGLGSGAITLRGPFAWLFLGVMAAPWAVGMYVIVRAVTAYLSRPPQPFGSPPPPRFSQRAAAYRRRAEE